MDKNMSNNCIFLVYGLSKGTRVFWKNLIGKRLEGTIEDWDNGTAIIKMDDGKTMAIRSE